MDDDARPPTEPLTYMNAGVGEIRARHPRAYERWTAEEDARLVAAFQAGRGIDDLATDFQRQPTAIESRLKRLALDMLREGRLDRSP